MVTITLTMEEAARIMYELTYLVMQIDRVIAKVSTQEDSPERTSSIEYYTERKQALEKVKSLLVSEIYGAKSTTDLTPTEGGSHE